MRIGGRMYHLGNTSRHLRLMEIGPMVAGTHRLHAVGWRNLQSTVGAMSNLH